MGAGAGTQPLGGRRAADPPNEKTPGDTGGLPK
jgi:hypothetical protein